MSSDYIHSQNLCYNCFQEKPDADGPCPYCGFDLAENEKKFPVALRAGTVLNDRYIVGRVLGQGGFGITYLALDTQLNAKVAIKEFMPNDIATRIGTTVSVAMDSKSEEFTYGAERFQEEARTLAKFIGNPNIAGVSSYFDENDTSYFVMDYIEGISFKTYIANHGGKISVEETLNVMIPVLRALTAVHAEGFIHRDVTPDNIYITKDGIVKLLDFGSARYSIGDKSKSLDVILKVGYAPKEQYIRRSRQGPFTDVYSCAACFYAAITGFLPPESLERLDEDTLVPISQCGIEIPEYLDKAILKGLAVQPEDRFQSAAEFLDAIESQQVVEVPGKAPAAPTAGGQLDALITKVKQRPKLYGAIAAAAVVVLVAVGVLTGGGGGGGGSIAEALAPTLTIAGQQVSAAEEFLELTEGTFTDADVETMHQMTNLRRIYLDGVTIETDGLDWVAEFPELTEFSCQGYTESELDLTPFAGLKDLTRLSFYQNGNLTAPAGDLSPLAELTELTRLDLCIDYEVKDLSPLAGMTRLESVQIYGNNNNGSGSGLTDISGLAGMTDLTSLRIDLGAAEDLAPLSGLTNLQELRMYGDFILEDLSFLHDLTQLRTLNMSGAYEGVPIQADLTDLSSLVNLTELQIDVPVASLHGLEPLTNLRNLQMYGGSNSTYTDVDALAGLTELVSLYLPYRAYNYENPLPLINLDGLSNLTKLQSLEISDGVESLEPLRNLTELRELRIRANNSDDGELNLAPLAGLTKLTSLDIYGDLAGGDLSALSGLTELRTLTISHYDRNAERYDNREVIRDLSPLAGLTKLSSLDISGAAANIDTSPVSYVSNLNVTE
ncbi:protein kinase [uncultured Oscillibacter sp.]|uniref:protein kinase domain-containing protein n=1 Tax=uncultured Oscillibacter sp. TaxID=876091 RepID=UPI002805DB7A|nr:protein kinase [uncultured Oscillibacter sp.]